MADNDRKWVCKIGDDPKNPETKGAVATIFDANEGKSYYHLAKKNAEIGGLDKAIKAIKPDYVPDTHGSFSFSQKFGTPGFNPLELNKDHREAITLEFTKGRLTECRIDSGSTAGQPIPIVDVAPEPAKPAASGPVRKAEVSLDPSMA
jgi:hypothetical protein